MIHLQRGKIHQEGQRTEFKALAFPWSTLHFFEGISLVKKSR